MARVIMYFKISPFSLVSLFLMEWNCHSTGPKDCPKPPFLFIFSAESNVELINQASFIWNQASFIWSAFDVGQTLSSTRFGHRMTTGNEWAAQLNAADSPFPVGNLWPNPVQKFQISAIERVRAFVFHVLSSVISYEIILHVHLVHLDGDKFNRCGGRAII